MSRAERRSGAYRRVDCSPNVRAVSWLSSSLVLPQQSSRTSYARSNTCHAALMWCSATSVSALARSRSRLRDLIRPLDTYEARDTCARWAAILHERFGDQPRLKARNAATATA